MIKLGKLIQQNTTHFGGWNKKLLGLGLGMTFMMWGVQMQLKRMLRLMFNVFEEASGSTSLLMQKFNIMRANLGSIAIAFWDAFAQSPLFESLLNLVTSLTQWFIDLDDTTKQTFTSNVFWIFGVILAINILGQTILALNTIMAMNPFVLYTLLAITALLFIRKVWKDTNSEIEESGKKNWKNWGYHALDVLAIVAKAMVALSVGPLGKWLGLTKGIENTIDKMRKNLEAIGTNISISDYASLNPALIGPQGSYKEMNPKAISSGYYGSSMKSKGSPESDYKMDIENLLAMQARTVDALNKNANVTIVNIDDIRTKLSPYGSPLE